jgi:hypothetical protein
MDLGERADRFVVCRSTRKAGSAVDVRGPARVGVVTIRVCIADLALAAALYRAKTRSHACDLQVRSPAGHVMIMRWLRDSST